METTTIRSPQTERIERFAPALSNGLIVVNSVGEIVWIDDGLRRSINGGLHDLSLPLVRDDAAADCFLSAVEVVIDGKPVKLSVLQECVRPDESGRDIVAAVEAVLSDTSWFKGTMIEKLRAWYQARRSVAKPADLERLTEREREILALICDGRSDYEMSRLLGLSQNTVRNHVASLYRKIGVNRRSAAIIWARERALTTYEFTAARRRSRSDRAGEGR